jgi:hypothetical protein
MSASKLVPLALPALALLAACATAPYQPAQTVAAAPPPAPPPPSLTGALGAPLAPATTAPLSGSSAPVAAGAPMRMSAAEISTAFADNTAQGTTANGLPYAIFFTPDGTERFRQGDFTDIGTWRVLPDGRFCSSLTRLGGNAEECYVMYRSANTITFQRPDGVSVGNVNLLPGNPLDL